MFYLTIKNKLIYCSMRTIFVCSLLVALMTLALLVSNTESRDLHKRSFTSLGCLGVYDKAKFARLDRVCEECYQLYREPDLHTSCRQAEFLKAHEELIANHYYGQDCFRNDVFGRCVDALLLSHEQKVLGEMVDDLYGRK